MAQLQRQHRAVLKYPLLAGSVTAVPGHPESPIALVAPDPNTGAPAIWIEQTVEEFDEVDGPVVKDADYWRSFHVVATGQCPPQGAVHRGSCVCHPFVWHIYEGNI